MSFKEFLKKFPEYQEIKESLDSPVNIDKIEKEGNLKFYYFYINDKEFRGILELSEDKESTNIIFEQKINGEFTTIGIQNNLSRKESLALFSTLKILNKYIKTKVNFIATDDPKKLRLYLKMMKIIPEIKSVTYESNPDYAVIRFSSEQKIDFSTKFKSQIFKK